MSTAITLPADKFDKTMTFVRPATLPSRVPLDKLAVLPGFNTRTKDGDYAERVAGVTHSIVQNGFFDDKPFAVVMIPNDETVYVYDGEHRFDAAKAAVLDGAEFPNGLPVAWAKEGATVRDLTIHLARGNEGAALNMVESAAVVRRLLDIGLDKTEIAKELNRSERHIENLITLGTANQTVKKAVAEGKIAGAEAVKLVRKHGAKEAGEKITEQVKAAEAKGKAKATPKTMAAAPTGPKMKRIEETISLATGTSLASLLAAISSHLQKHAKFDDDEALTEDGKLVLAIHVIDHEAIAAAAAAQKEREEKAAKREIERAEAAKVREAEKAERQKVKDAAAAAKAKEAAAAEKAKPKSETKAKGEAKTPAKPKTRTARPKTEKAAPAPEGNTSKDSTDDGMGGL